MIIIFSINNKLINLNDEKEEVKNGVWDEMKCNEIKREENKFTTIKQNKKVLFLSLLLCLSKKIKILCFVFHFYYLKIRFCIFM